MYGRITSSNCVGLTGRAESRIIWSGLVESSSGVSPTDLQDYLATIARSGRKMSSIINELLLLASVRQDDVLLEPVDMLPIVETALMRLEEGPGKANGWRRR